MGVESADQQILNDINKKTDLNKIINAFHISRKEKSEPLHRLYLECPETLKKAYRKL